MEAERWLLVGLGNPEPRYRGNRHNIGFMVVEQLARKAELPWRRSTRFSAEIALGELSKRPVVLAKPQTYMNLSGQCVVPLAHFYRVPCSRIIAVHDEVDLELGRLKVKQGGGDGGHNGLRSITELLGDPDYLRVRVGVGRPAVGDVTGHVLSDFRQEEAEQVADTIERAARAARTLITRGLKEAMNRFNRPPKDRSEEKTDKSPPADRATSKAGGDANDEEQTAGGQKAAARLNGEPKTA